MTERIKVAFASGLDDQNRELVKRMTALFPELPLYVVSEFPPESGRWIPYHVSRSLAENLARCRAAWHGKSIRLAGVLLVPQAPFRRMRLIALLVSPFGFLAFNEQFDSFMLRPRSLLTIARHLLWRTKNFCRWHLRQGGAVDHLIHPRYWRFPLLQTAALISGHLTKVGRDSIPQADLQSASVSPSPLPAGVTVVIPTRDGATLLTQSLPAIEQDLTNIPSEIILVDNGSSDGTATAFATRATVEVSPEPLSFAAAVNRGIARARYSHVCLLNNDMLVAPNFFRELRAPFTRVPDLFCATAQIFLREGQRREETGKAVMARDSITDFPVRCEVPLPGEDETYVLYGSGGCSLYDTAKLRALGGVREIYEPAYVEDLDLGYRAWARGWPTVFAARASVEHRHRATTSRYYSPAQLDAILEINYLRFLTTAVNSAKLFRRLWRDAVTRLRLLGKADALKFAIRAPLFARRPPKAALPESEFLALTNGDVYVFPGRAPSAKPVILVASPYAPFPLSHGGAVRMFNLMRRAAADYDQVLICFSTDPATPPPELLDICVEVVVVKLTGSHSRPSTARPDVVEEFDAPAFHAALRQTLRKWRPVLAQLEFTQMAQYAADCAPAPTILVEHDVTFDLYEQLLRLNDDWELRRQLDRWRQFETAAWNTVTRVVTMSEKDRKLTPESRGVALPNGVDLERFHPSAPHSKTEPEPARLLFIGSFAHLPNLLALEFFVTQVWPLLDDIAPTLHVIAGMRHEYFLDFYKDRATLNLSHPRIEVEGFVSDVRPAYERAAIVIAPLIASAGTNIKILEAMAMGKAIVSTLAGINGLDLDPADATVTQSPEEMAAAIRDLIGNPSRRRALESHARETAERRFSWDVIAARQKEMYQLLAG